MNQLVAEYVARKKRLWEPLNGRVSSELEVISSAEQKRRAAAAIAKERAAKAREAEERQAQLTRAFIDAHKRTRFQFTQFAVDDGVKVVTFEQITRAVCQFYQQPRLHLFSQRRIVKLVRPRHIIMYLAREYTALSLPSIGRLCGGRDHTTALYGANKIKLLLDNGDEKLLADLAEIKKALGIT